jgi:hypothetical protein
MDMNMSAEMQSKLKTDPKLDWGTIVMNTFASYPVSM